MNKHLFVACISKLIYSLLEVRGKSQERERERNTIKANNLMAAAGKAYEIRKIIYKCASAQVRHRAVGAVTRLCTQFLFSVGRASSPSCRRRRRPRRPWPLPTQV